MYIIHIHVQVDDNNDSKDVKKCKAQLDEVSSNKDLKTKIT